MIYLSTENSALKAFWKSLFDEDGIPLTENPAEAGLYVIDLDTREKPESGVAAITVSADPFVFCDLPRPFLTSRFLALCREKLEGFGAKREGITPCLSNEPENNSNEFVFEGNTVTVQGERIALSPAEYRLLSLLYEHRGQAVSLKACSDAIGNAEKGNAASVYINHLRRKLDYHFDRRMIVTLRQKGYMLLSV